MDLQSGIIDVDENGEIGPGEKGRVRIYPWVPTWWSEVRVGSMLEMLDGPGPRILGIAQVTQLHLGIEPLAPASTSGRIDVGIPGTDPRDAQQVMLFRAVSLEEAEDIERCGCLRPRPDGGSLNGKWLAATRDLAMRFGAEWTKLRREPTFRVASMRLPLSQFERLPGEAMRDDIGLSFYTNALTWLNGGIAGSLHIDEKEHQVPTIQSPQPYYEARLFVSWAAGVSVKITNGYTATWWYDAVRGSSFGSGMVHVLDGGSIETGETGLIRIVPPKHSTHQLLRVGTVLQMTEGLNRHVIGLAQITKTHLS